jgi:hypothetical protein
VASIKGHYDFIEKENERERRHSVDPQECTPDISYLLVKTRVSFKNDGLYCKGCVKPLSRAGSSISLKETEQTEIG